MLKTLNNMVAQLNNGVDDNTLEQMDSFYQKVNPQDLNFYESIAYYELDRLLWQAFAM
mgnify:CR=1 FL=1